MQARVGAGKARAGAVRRLGGNRSAERKARSRAKGPLRAADAEEQTTSAEAAAEAAADVAAGDAAAAETDEAPAATPATAAAHKPALDSDTSVLAGDGRVYSGMLALIAAAVVGGGVWFLNRAKANQGPDALTEEDRAAQEEDHAAARLRIRQAIAVQSAINFMRMANNVRAHVEIERAIDVHTECRRAVLLEGFQKDDVHRVYKLAVNRLSGSKYPRMKLFQKMLSISDGDAERLEAEAADEQKGSFVI